MKPPLGHRALMHVGSPARRWALALLLIPTSVLCQIAPMSYDECDTMQRQLEQRASELDAQATAIHDQIYHRCVDLRDTEATFRCWNRVQADTYGETTDCGYILYNYPKYDRNPRYQAACAYMKARAATQSCRSNVDAYLARRAAAQSAATAAANNASSQSHAPTGPAVVMPVVPSVSNATPDIPSSFKQCQDSGAISANAERTRLATSAARNWRPPAELTAAAYTTATAGALQDPFASHAGSSSNREVVQGAVIGALKAEADALNNTALKATAESLEVSVTASREMARAQSINEGTASARDQVDFAASAVKQVIDTTNVILEMQDRSAMAPLFGFSELRSGFEGIFSLWDNVAGAADSQGLFSTNAASVGGSYDPGCDMRRFGLTMLAPVIGGLQLQPEGCPRR